MLIATVSVIIIIEILGRVLGITNPPLYIESPEFQYMYAANQNVTFYGNKIQTNEYSMRSLPLSQDDYLRILLIGDSIIHGGKHTDQDSLASTLLEDSLSVRFKRKIRVLNISGGGWGPDNIFAYLKKYGSFNASLMVLVVSNHDYTSRMGHEKIVGIATDFPAKRPVSVLIDLCDKYLFSKLHKNRSGIDHSVANVRNPGFDSLVAYADKNGIQLKAVLHPTKTEIMQHSLYPGALKIAQFFDSCTIPVLSEISNNSRNSNYLDEIHYNEKGQRFLFNELYPLLINYVEEYLKTVKQD